MVTHDQEEAISMSDRIAIMNEGRIIQVDTPQEIYSNPKDFFSANFIGDINTFLYARFHSIDTTRTHYIAKR